MTINLYRRRFLSQSALLAQGVLLFGCDGSPGDSSMPNILIQPMDVSVSAGESAIFQVKVESSGTFTYQWQKNSIDIPGAVNSEYITPVLTIADTGSVFSVVITNLDGSVRSREAKLIVTQLEITVDSTLLTIDSTQITIDRV